MGTAGAQSQRGALLIVENIPQNYFNPRDKEES